MPRKTVVSVIGIVLIAGAASLTMYLLRMGPFAESFEDEQQAPPAASPTGPDGGDGDSDEAPPKPPSEPEEPPPPQPLGWGPNEDHFSAAQQAVAAMSDEELAGQVMISHWSGTSPEAAAKTVRDHHLAGLILMGPNIEGADQITAVSDGVQNQQQDAGRDWPAIISVDQEGGRVSRLESVIDPVPAFGKLASEGTSEVRDVMQRMGEQMMDLGFTMDFAPVADISIGPQNPTIGDRAAGSEPEIVAKSVEAALDGLLAGGVIPTVKHFPGHGSVTTDSHVEVPIQDRDLDDLRENDFVPFQAAVSAGVPVVMMGHVALEVLDPQVPASLSAPAYELLRDELGFDGVIVTDAMNMQAITKSTGVGQEALRALEAGADLVLMPTDIAAAHDAVVGALASGDLDRDRIEEAATRVVALQMWFGEALED